MSQKSIGGNSARNCCQSHTARRQAKELLVEAKRKVEEMIEKGWDMKQLLKKKKVCPECGGVIKPGHTEMVYELGELKIIIKNVQATICSKCGQSFITGRVAEEVNRLVNRVSEDVISFIKTQPEVSQGLKEVAIAV